MYNDLMLNKSVKMTNYVKNSYLKTETKVSLKITKGIY